MANFYRSREGSIPDDDVKTQLTTLGSQTAPGPLLVPGGATFLRAAWVSVATSGEAADSYAALCRLEGPGIDRGSIEFPVGAGGTQVATGGQTHVPSVRIPLNIAVREAQEIGVFGELLGGDMGTSELAVTLEFGTEAGPEGEIKGDVVVEGEVTAVDTLTRLTTQGSVTAPSRLVPPDASTLSHVVYAIGHDGAADGEVTYFLRLSGDAIKGGEQVINLGASGSIAGQAGSDEALTAMPPMILDGLDLEITPNESLDISLEMAGVDIGTVTAVVGAYFV